MLKKILNILPFRCQLCRQLLPTRGENEHPLPLICRSCEGIFSPQARCQRCALPTPTPLFACGECQRHPPSWDRMICLTDYKPPFNVWLHQLKFGGHFWLADQLAKPLSLQIDNPAPALASVPMHWRRRLKRGFNQSELIARPLAKYLNATFHPQLLVRHHATQPQRGLTRQQRLTNLDRVFQVHGDAPKHLALVDDVVTTGATVEALAKALKNAGAEQVDVYTICRTPPENQI